MADPVPSQVIDRFDYLIQFVVDSVPIALKCVSDNDDSFSRAALKEPPAPQIAFFVEIEEKFFAAVVTEMALQGVADEDQDRISQAFCEALAIGHEEFKEPNCFANHDRTPSYNFALTIITALALTIEVFQDLIIRSLAGEAVGQAVDAVGKCTKLSDEEYEISYQQFRKIVKPPGFPYRSLNNDVKEIRLLCLLPSADTSAIIQCELIHCCLGKHSYAALSYVWGQYDDSSPTILLEGSLFRVTANLYSALMSFRHPTRPLVMWVDALCINQLDIAERNHQVAQMGAIYETASCVLMWLGEASDDSDLAMEWLLRCEYVTGKNIYAAGTEAIDFWKEDEFVPHIQALEKLTARSYWNRLWILQEVILGQKAYIACGNYRASWMTLAVAFVSGRHQFYTHLEKTMDDGRPLFLTVANIIYAKIRPLAELWARRLRGSPVSFPEGLLNARERDATDNRDHVYGILGIVDCAPVEVDYTEPVFEIYRDAVVRYINGTGNLDILTACKRFDDENPPWEGVLDFDTSTPSLLRNLGAEDGDPSSIERAAYDVWKSVIAWRQEPDNSPWDVYSQNTAERLLNDVGLKSLPSWVPRWNEKVHFEEYILFANLDGNFSAGGCSLAECELHPNGRLLVVKGLPLNFVEYVRQPLRDGKEMLAALKEDWQTWCSMYRDRGNNPYGDTPKQFDAYRNTITLGKDPIVGENIGDANWFRKFFHKTIMGWDEDLKGDLENLDTSGPGLNNAKLIDRSYHSLQKPFHQRFFITEKGHMGLGPPAMKKGDLVCIFLGGKVPFVIRETSFTTNVPRSEEIGGEESLTTDQEAGPNKEYQYYFLLGEAYLEGVMDMTWGEKFTGCLNRGEIEPQDFPLV